MLGTSLELSYLNGLMKQDKSEWYVAQFPFLAQGISQVKQLRILGGPSEHPVTV